ncbi:hypothetical protein B296_00036669, partial [Ensete ventricosum]
MRVLCSISLGMEREASPALWAGEASNGARTRFLSHPSRDSGPTVVVLLSGGVTPVDPRVADALATMRSFFNVDSIVTTCRLKEGMKDMNEAWLAEVGLSPAPQGMFFLLVYHAGCFSDCTLSYRDVPVEKGKEPVVTEEAPECEYTLRELCKVEDRVGAEKYFATVMTRLKVVEGKAPMMSRWSTISELSQFWTKGPLSGEYLWGALHPALAKQVYECSSEELKNRAGKSTVWLESLKYQQRRLEEEVGVLHSSLDGDWNNRARLEGDVLSLIEVATLLEAELKVEGPRAVAFYKASRGFESGLEKMGRVSYEFGYQVALERLHRKHLEIEAELDPFAKCPEDANVGMDLSQPFNGSTPSKKYLT